MKHGAYVLLSPDRKLRAAGLFALRKNFLEARTPANLPRVRPGARLQGGAKLDFSVAMTVNLSHGVSRPDRRYRVARFQWFRKCRDGFFSRRTGWEHDPEGARCAELFNEFLERVRRRRTFFRECIN